MGRQRTPLLLVDGNNLIWPAHYRPRRRISSRSGQDVTVVQAFLSTVRAALADISPPAESVVCFDGAGRAGNAGGESRRRAEATPLRRVPDIMAGLALMGVRWLRSAGSTADDVIATLVGRDAGRTVYIMSADRDFYQLVSESVCVLGTGLSGRRRSVGPDEIVRRYGVLPEQWCDYTALVGRSSRSTPGARRLHPAAAAALLAAGARLEDLGRLGRLEAPETAWLRDPDSWSELLHRRSSLTLRANLDVDDVTTGKATTALPEPSEVLKQLGLT